MRGREMKEGWEYKKLKELCEYSIGLTYKPQDVCDDGTIVLRSSNIQNELLDLTDIVRVNCPIKESLFVQRGDILMCSRNGSARLVGKVAMIPETNERMTYGTFMMIIRGSYNPFLLYFFKSNVFRDQIKHGEANMINQITRYMLDDVVVSVPPLSEQQSIVDYLDSAFAKIDAMKANAEKALNEAKALFQASLKEMLEPKEGWEERALKDFAIDMYRGSGVKRDQVTEYGIPCVRYGEIYTKYNYHFNECHSHTLAEYVSSPKYFEYGDILFAITGESVEDIAKSIAYLGTEKCIAGGDTVVMKHHYEPRYISYALSTPSAIKQKGHGKTKLKVVHTNIPSLKEIIIPIAPMNEQIRIADTLDTINIKVDRLQKNYDKISQECDALKQAILRQVFE